MGHYLSSVASRNFIHASGREVWRTNLDVAEYLGRKVKSTLGPMGMLKLIFYNKGPERVVKVTKDAVSILEELNVEYPAMQVYSEASKIQREEVGDGVASFVILVSELIRRATKLVDLGLNMSVVLDGYSLAADWALEIIDRESVSNVLGLKETLEVADCAKGLVRAKIAEFLEAACLNASQNGKLDTSRIVVLKKPGSNPTETEMIRGYAIDRADIYPKQSWIIHEPRIAFVGARFGVSHLEVRKPGEGRFPFRLNIDEPAKISSFRYGIRELNLEYVRELKACGANLLICRQLVNEELLSTLAREGIFVVKSVDKQVFETAARVTGGSIVDDLEDMRSAVFGTCQDAKVIRIEPEYVVLLEGCSASTLILRASTSETMTEYENAVKACISLSKHWLQDRKFVLGGGAIEMQVSRELRQRSLSLHGREQLAVVAFAEALEEIPRTLAVNSGRDEIDTIAELRMLHSIGKTNYGIGVSGCDNMSERGIWELSRVKRSVIRRAVEVARLMLRIDYIAHSTEIAKFHKK